MDAPSEDPPNIKLRLVQEKHLLQSRGYELKAELDAVEKRLHYVNGQLKALEP